MSKSALDDLSVKRTTFTVGEKLHSGPVGLVPFNSPALNSLLDDLRKQNIVEFAIDLIIDSSNNTVRGYLDAESRKYRRLRGWSLPKQGTQLQLASFDLGLEIFSKAKALVVHKPDGIDLTNDFHRLTIELTFSPSGNRPRAYDLAPHIDALCAYIQNPVVEGLWSDEVSTKLYAGDHSWADTTHFRQSTAGLEKLNIPPKNLSISRGATLIHGAPITDRDRWLLRCFVEPVSRSLAYDCRTGIGRDLSFRTRP